MCPDGLVLDGSGGCIHKDQCPCVHGGHFYKPGETIKVDCNTWYVILGRLVLELRLVKLACMVGPWGRVYFEAFLFITRAIRFSVNIKGKHLPLQHTAQACAWGEQVPSSSVKQFPSFSANRFQPALEVPASSRLVCGWSLYREGLSPCLLGTAKPQKRICFRGGRNHNDLPVSCSAFGCVALK